MLVAMTESRDVQSSLADMDRKLRELQRELAMVSRGPEGTAFSPPAFSAPPPPPPPDTAPAPAAEAEAQAQAKAQEIIADARAEAARIVGEAAERVAAIGRQIDELQRLRDELQRSAQALVEEYERALRTAPVGDVPPASAPPPPPQVDGREFDGQVVIDAGPFTDIATLGSFEQALARLPQAEDVYVREFTGSRALIDVLLAAPVALLDEMRRTAPVGFGLVEVADGRIIIEVDAPRTEVVS
jgi:hypothetical protein